MNIRQRGHVWVASYERGPGPSGSARLLAHWFGEAVARRERGETVGAAGAMLLLDSVARLTLCDDAIALGRGGL